MKIVLSTIGKFHSFDLARELYSHGMLAKIYSGYPAYKLKQEQLPLAVVQSFPWVHAPYLAVSGRGWLGTRASRNLEYLDRTLMDRYVSLVLPKCNIFIGLSGAALMSGVRAKSIGARYVCDRGSTHIKTQDRLLRDEYRRWGRSYIGIDPRIVDLEEQEYAEADAITVPSQFNLRSFMSEGITSRKVTVLPYGVNLHKFYPISRPPADSFEVLFVGSMSLRKGVPDLLSAYKKVTHPKKRLTFVGSWSREFIEFMRQLGLWSDEIRLTGHMPQETLKHVMSTSHVMVLPSIEEGLAMVQAQAMACGCPVIATPHTGAEDLFDDSVEGFIVPVRCADVLADRLQALADQPNMREQMGAAALKRVAVAGGWRQYGERAIALYEKLVAE